MSTAEVTLRRDLVSWAAGQVGTMEAPARSNRVIYWAMTRPGYQGEPWCGAFTTATVLAVTGVNLANFFNAFFTPDIVTFAKAHGAWKTGSELPADWCLMNWPGGNSVDHVGITVAGQKNVEGNTSNSNAGSQSNGGGVFVRTRSRGLIAGWVDIIVLLKAVGLDIDAWYAHRMPVPTSGRLDRGTVGTLQRYLNHAHRPVRTWAVLTVDGDFGPLSRMALQTFLHVTADGDFGPKSTGALETFLHLPLTGARGMTRNDIRALQRFLSQEILSGRLPR